MLNTTLPFKCPFCGESPTLNHTCEGLEKAVAAQKVIESRLKEIIMLADTLSWIEKKHYYPKQSYPLMQLSEVEKCMLAMVSDSELNRMRDWANQTNNTEQTESSK